MQTKQRKIIHIDMDCFYAAIEIRDKPELADKPVAIGGDALNRGVLSTCNYVARRYGLHSAMATVTAHRLCKDLILLPVDMQKYKYVAKRIQQIFFEFTDLVEPLALDEAFLDVSDTPHCQGSATLIADEIRKRIWQQETLTASAGVAPNKFLAKIASGWKKPNGLFVIRPNEVASFVKTLAVKELFGVGKVTALKLQQMGINTCEDLQRLSLSELTHAFGKLGYQLHDQCRGFDAREVKSNRQRKSLSVEHTFPEDITDRDLGLSALKVLYEKLQVRIKESAVDLPIKNQFIKIKFSNFRQVTCEKSCKELDFAVFEKEYLLAYAKVKMPIRLLGIGIHFNDETLQSMYQHSLF